MLENLLESDINKQKQNMHTHFKGAPPPADRNKFLAQNKQT